MAVRFSNTGQSYTRALALGSQAALTVCGWFKLSVDRNNYSTIFFIDNGTGDNWGMQTGVDGTTMATVFDASTQQGIGSMTVGTWYFICLSTSGTTGNIYYRTASQSTLTTVAVTSVTASVNAATLRIGESPWGGEWLNGVAAGLKGWSAALTLNEAHQESMQYQPNRLSNLLFLHPFLKAETADYSGNARTLSGGTGATTEDGPPIPWRTAMPRWISVAPAGGHTNSVGQPAETDTATTITRSKARAVGQCTETDTATAVTRSKRVVIGQATEVSTATTVARRKSRMVAQPAESGLSFSVTSAHRRTVGQSAETSTGSAVTRQKSRAVGQPAETDTATAVTRRKARVLGQPIETDTAAAVSRGSQHTVTVGQALEADTATALARSKRRALTQPVEADSAGASARAKLRATGLATETDTAAAASRVKRRQLGQPVEADTATSIQGANAPVIIGQALEVSSATTVTRVKRRGLAIAQVLSTAQPLARAKVLHLGQPIETDTSRSLATTVTVAAEPRLSVARNLAQASVAPNLATAAVAANQAEAAV